MRLLIEIVAWAILGFIAGLFIQILVMGSVGEPLVVGGYSLVTSATGLLGWVLTFWGGYHGYQRGKKHQTQTANHPLPSEPTIWERLTRSNEYIAYSRQAQAEDVTDDQPRDLS